MEFELDLNLGPVISSLEYTIVCRNNFMVRHYNLNFSFKYDSKGNLIKRKPAFIHGAIRDSSKTLYILDEGLR